MAAETESKWEGKVSAVLANPTAQQVWLLLEDFCNLHKWLPSIDTCYQVDGVPGQPGLIRYCAATVTSSSGGRDDGVTINWAKEKLLAIDPIKRCLSYEVVENNTGIKSYVATMIVLPINDDGGRGCKIEWSFVSDPIEGWRIEDLVSYLESNLQGMAKRMLHHYALLLNS
ncbi:hypothetical protein FH972_013380 [Carpinus fangiana]|uniref:Bet v I/Major latex protein domain-containing protein n=1 Tax=Carpinus fangiana TaxID=176857 RepID=A0A5N6R6U2_9ROSI|nr:hypothetical protein FH972_013380 [Carpinus fangiana]